LDQFSSDDGVLCGAHERRLEDVVATFDHGYSDYVGSWSKAYYGGVLEDQFISDDGVLYEAQKRSHSLIEAQE
jgi:hypothetical protein